MLYHTLLILLLSTLGVSDDRTALLLLSSTFNGSTVRWNRTLTSPCLWEGVGCNNITYRVTSLRLPADGLSGQIPVNSIGNLTKLRTLSLRHNSLSGQLPFDLGSCIELRTLVLRDNRFSGELPESLFRLPNLVRFDLSVNNFSGRISPGFNNFVVLQTLYLENNQFAGSIPELSSVPGLRQFNVSFNRLNGSIPFSLRNFSSTSFLGNSLAPFSVDRENTLSGLAIAGIAVGSLIALLFVILSLYLIHLKRHNHAPEPVIDGESDDVPLSADSESSVTETTTPTKIKKTHGDDGLVLLGEDNIVSFSLVEMLKASAEVLGRGICGTTYKTYLGNGAELIVKRLSDVCVSETDFRERVEELSTVVHDNLVPLRAYYYNKDEKLLIYDSIPMALGSLHSLLHDFKRDYKSELTWEFRTETALQVAVAIHHLHSFSPNLTHGNIKASNIIITDQNKALVSEFGIIQLLDSVTSDLNGYRAPEVIDTRKISQKADIYSFGILLLELLTGKKPTLVVEEEGVDLSTWVESVIAEKWTIDVFDDHLLSYKFIEEKMVKVLHLAVSCACQNPDRRPPINKVIRELKRICGI